MNETLPTGALAPVICVVGARPNYMKVAPIIRAFASNSPALRTLLVHTGQHYDGAMSDVFFDDLGLRSPDVHLGTGSGGQAEQVARVVGFEGQLSFDASRPDGTPRKLLDISRIAELGWAPRIPLEEGIRATYEWFIQNQSDARGM